MLLLFSIPSAAGRVVKAKHKHFENFILAVKIVPLVAKEMQDELGTQRCFDPHSIINSGLLLNRSFLEKEMEILKTCRSDNVIAYYGCIIRDSDTWVRFCFSSTRFTAWFRASSHCEILMDYCGAGAVKDVMNATGDTLNEKQIQYVVRSTLKGTRLHARLQLIDCSHCIRIELSAFQGHSAPGYQGS